MKTTKAVHGVLPVFQTAYDDDESIDYGTVEREIEWLFDHGADGVVMAMVSEVLRLSSDERMKLAEIVVRKAASRGAVVISVGAESSKVAEEFTRHAEAAGADAVMAIPPVSVPVPEAELESYYSRILNASDLPVIVQDASGYVGRPMSIELQARLLEEFGADRVWFKPEATPIVPRLIELRQATAGKAKVFEGTGGIALVESYAVGVAGTMPGADLIQALVALWRALTTGDSAKAAAIHRPLSELIDLQTRLDAFLAVEKHLLHRQGVFPSTRIRGPVGCRLDAETLSKVDHLFDHLSEVVEARKDGAL